ncbi:MAG: FMN-binding protein [Trebonia sp.]
MRRAVVIFGTTAAGLAALFSYKTHVAGVAVADTTPTTPTITSSAASPSATASPFKVPTKKATPKASPKPTVTHSTAPATTPTHSTTTEKPTPPPSTSAPAGKTGTFTGAPVNTQYGPVQVSITVNDGKITNADGRLPQGGDSIGQNALPRLNQEALTAHSANIQAVSGATYTSHGYIGSLQQALNEAGL